MLSTCRQGKCLFVLENKLPLTFLKSLMDVTPIRVKLPPLKVVQLSQNGRLNLNAVHEETSHIEINLSNQFRPQLSRTFM